MASTRLNLATSKIPDGLDNGFAYATCPSNKITEYNVIAEYFQL